MAEGDAHGDVEPDAAPSALKKSGSTPLPLKQCLCVLVIQFNEGVQVTLLFPFAAFMIEWFGFSEAEEGTYLGLLFAAFFTAQFCTGVIWGRVSDVWGRRPCVLFALAASTFPMLLLGFVKKYYLAVLCRVVAGALAGNMGVIKSILTEISDETNRAKAFSFMPLAWSGGLVVGSLTGGTFAEPAESFGFISKDGLFGEFPFLLPCLIAAVLSLMCLVYCYFFLEETLKSKRKIAPETVLAGVTVEQEMEEAVPVKVKLPRPMWVACFCYFFLACGELVFEGMIPVFCKLDKDQFGLSFSASQIGILMTIKGFSLFLFSLFWAPAVEKRLGTCRLFVTGCWVLVPIFLFYPLQSYFSDSDALLWLSLAIVMSLYAVAVVSGFLGSIVMVNNSVDSSKVGLANGIGQSFASVARAAGPAIGGIIWSAAGNLSGIWRAWLPFLFPVLSISTAAVIGMAAPRSLGRPYQAQIET